MAFLKVLNVQQGDCMTFRPCPLCRFRNELFYVDLGNGRFDVSKEIGAKDKVHLILTHSHRDHIYGFSHLLPYMGQVEELILPYCHNEIWLIAKAILNLKGMSASWGCEDLKRELIDIDLIQRTLKRDLGNPRLRITLAYDGLSLCDHIHFWNPHLPSVPKDWLTDAEYQEAEKKVRELFEEEFADKYLGYVRAEQRSFGVDHSFYQEFLYGRQDEENRDQMLNMGRAGCKMTLKFLSAHYKTMQAFNGHPDRATLKRLVDGYQMTAHDACLVTMLLNEDKRYLLGGDASKKVFYRLIKTRSIHANYFKLPHHGSDKNLDGTILQNVDPDFAIISHGNGKFGNARDTHPNRTVLDLLSGQKIPVLLTNDVIKNGKVVLQKTPYSTADVEIE